MRRGDDSSAEAAGLLREEVRHVGLRIQQALPNDGEAAQPRTGGCWYRHRLHEQGARHRIYVSRESRGQGCHHRDIQSGNRGDGGRTLYGTPAILHYRQEWTDVCSPLSASKQLESQEPLSVRKLQYDQHRRGVPVSHPARAVAAYLWRLIHHTGADGASLGPRGGTTVSGGSRERAGRARHHQLYRRPRRDGKRAEDHHAALRWRLCDVRSDGQR